MHDHLTLSNAILAFFAALLIVELASIGTVIQDFPTSDIFKVGIPIERGGVPMELKGGSILCFIVQDDLTGLDYFEAIANGVYAS